MTGSLSENTGSLSFDAEACLIAALRAARFALGWSQADLAQHSGISEATIARIETYQLNPRYTTLTRMRVALEDAGVTFQLYDPSGGFGIALSDAAVQASRRRCIDTRERKAATKTKGKSQDPKNTRAAGRGGSGSGSDKPAATPNQEATTTSGSASSDALAPTSQPAAANTPPLSDA